MAKQDVLFDTDIGNSNSKDIYKDIHKLDVNLKRLIQSCENLISNSNSNRDLLSVEKFIPVLFTKYSQLKDLIENKSNQLHKSLTTSSSTTSTSLSPLQSSLNKNNNTSSSSSNNEQLEKSIPSKETLSEYSRKINVLLGLVNQEKLNSPISTRLSMIRLQSSNIPHGEKMNEVHTVMKTRNKEEKKKTDLLLSSPHSNQSSQQNVIQATSPTLRYRAKFQNQNSELSKLLGTSHQEDRLDDPEQLSQLSFQDITNQQRSLQDELAREMSDAAMHLKNHTNKMSTMLTSDMNRLDELNTHLSANHSKIGEEHVRLKTYTTRNRKDTLNYFLIIVMVMVLFMVTYFFMKITPVPKQK